MNDLAMLTCYVVASGRKGLLNEESSSTRLTLLHALKLQDSGVGMYGAWQDTHHCARRGQENKTSKSKTANPD